MGLEMVQFSTYIPLQYIFTSLENPYKRPTSLLQPYCLEFHNVRCFKEKRNMEVYFGEVWRRVDTGTMYDWVASIIQK